MCQQHRCHFKAIVFHNRAGELVTFQSAHGDAGNSSRFQVNVKVDVFYDLARKMEPMMALRMAMWGEPFR